MLPLAHRTLENIIYLVEQEMTSVGGARMVAPILTPSALWKKSGEMISLFYVFTVVYYSIPRTMG